MNNLNHSRTLAARLFAAGLLLASAGSAWAAVRYVDVNNAGTMWPYTSWETAASSIQEAIEFAEAGDEIVVTNGIYSVGGRSTVDQPTTTNRVVVDKPLTLRSVNGPQFTTIDGRGVFRCVYLTNAASLSGFTLTNGRAQFGGGLWCASTDAVAFNCVVSGNSSFRPGPDFMNFIPNCCHPSIPGPIAGGVYGGTLNNCILSDNRAETYSFEGPICDITTCHTVSAGLYQRYYVRGYGGGAYCSLLNNCTLGGNSAGGGGGAYGCILNNCVAYFNTGENYDSSSTLNYSCTTPQPTNGAGNITNAPLFVNLAAGNYRLRPDSPCIDAGTNLSASITNDLDGRPRPLDGNGDGLAAFDMGAYEYRTPLLVWQDSPNPNPPHADWATAAHTIQDAVDAAVAGDEIVVTNGTYSVGGRSTIGQSTTTNRVVVDKPLALRSVNGPQSTIINGGGVSRCVYLTNGASLSGFTLTNGYVLGDGAGVFCESQSTVVTNCVLAANAAGRTGNAHGGGAFGGTLENCTLSGNYAAWGHESFSSGGGAYGSTLNTCTLNSNSALEGGGASACTLTNCTLIGNSAGAGGGAVGCMLHNCTLDGNSASGDLNLGIYGGFGGGAYRCTLNNCTLSGNSAQERFGGRGHGASACTLNNCVVYFNTGPQGYPHQDENYDYSCALNYSCTTPLPPTGVGNITNAPLFVDQASGNLRLQSNSPCINAGLNAFAPAGPDLEANPRIVGGTVDLGAYEFQSPASIISYAWLQQYALPTDGSADSADPDGDGLNNWKEWRCATDPTNALSAVRLLAPATGGTNLIVTWQSVTGVNYFLERSTAVSSAFTPVTTSIPGQPGTTTYTDTNAIGAGPWFYRVRVIVWPQEQPCLGPSPGPEYICVEGVWTHNGDGRL